MKKNNRLFFSLILLFSGVSFTSPALAHIKWFVEFDVSDPPLAVMNIATPLFLALLLLTTVSIFIAILIDETWARRAPLVLGQQLKLTDEYDDIALSIVRIGVGVFFVILWLIGGVVLTPDTATEAWWVPSLHVLIALSMLFRQTLILAGIGILILYGYCVYQLGLFHMVDYLTFLGLAIFLIISQINTKALMKQRLPILYLTLVIAFLWSAIEKLTFPQWFDPFLDKYPFLLMGLDREFYLLSAAFVEFTLFYLILFGRNAVTVIAVLANILIISGNIYFGKTDTIGHFPVNFVLVIMAVMGARSFAVFTGNGNGRIMLHAARQSGLFIAFFGVLFLSYYGLHWVQYGA